ncbi:hypothetical protein JAAARDRAFT_33430 [Jaapia argillacea MUCL 33604]|uniref:G domain-containing protein n=1 Tax=Jaapia argillacea MUCL 33604 TaxID=933084 RepID=A0A067Q149_9AGAM|nr:hypothetical protein JAAARDRAFT_33430 [Jaapia argillacea MUCL 33604]
MLADKELANTSSAAAGCTFQTKCHSIAKEGVVLNIFDTVGLDEGDMGSVASSEAIAKLYALVRDLDGGVNLLLYVVRGPRIQSSTRNNYRLFVEGFCQKKVPVVLLVTGMENEPSGEKWMKDNIGEYRKQKMEFSDEACITPFLGVKLESGGYYFQKEYDASNANVTKLILRRSLTKSWKMESVGWFMVILKSLYNTITPVLPGLKPTPLAKSLYLALCKPESIGTDLEAMKAANSIMGTVLWKDIMGSKFARPDTGSGKIEEKIGLDTESDRGSTMDGKEGTPKVTRGQFWKVPISIRNKRSGTV